VTAVVMVLSFRLVYAGVAAVTVKTVVWVRVFEALKDREVEIEFIE
jgi:hypothetical protein